LLFCENGYSRADANLVKEVADHIARSASCGLVSKRPSPFRMKDSAIRAGGREEGTPPNARQNGQTPAAGCR
jgi:hypothetical protein